MVGELQPYYFFIQDFDPEMADKVIRLAIKSTFEGTDGKDLDQKLLDKWTKTVTDSVLKQCSQDDQEQIFKLESNVSKIKDDFAELAVKSNKLSTHNSNLL